MSGGASAHEILGISARATAKEIRQAYKRLAREYHPDRNPSDEAAEMFMAVKAAHDHMLATLDAGTGSQSESPGFSQSRPSANRTTSRGATRSTGRPETGPRWRGPGSSEPGPAWSRTGSSRPRASWTSEPRIRIIDPVDLDDLAPHLEARDLYRSSIWIVAMLVWFVMFFGFLLTLRAMQRPSVETRAVSGSAEQGEPPSDVDEEPPAPRRARRR